MALTMDPGLVKTTASSDVGITNDNEKEVQIHDSVSVGARNSSRETIGTQSSDTDGVIPRYQIDLSERPWERYVHVARDFKHELKKLPKLVDDLIRDNMDQKPEKVHRWARRLLRGLCSKEETEEIRGISKTVDVPLYLFVCFNILLDFLMGCSSGGIRAENDDGSVNMLHYRTLDWNMDDLRDLVVQLDFITQPGGAVIARSITYVGFVGMVTAVRENLSLSLNFRPWRNNRGSVISDVRFYGHLLLVLLGWRPAISSKLRQLMLPSRGMRSKTLPDLESVIQNFPAVKTTAAYLILSDGKRTAVLEKDLVTANVIQSTDFIACTNHDVANEDSGCGSDYDNGDESDPKQHGLVAYLDNRRAPFSPSSARQSIRLKQSMNKRWQRHVKKITLEHLEVEECVVHAKLSDIERWVQAYPVLNDYTQFACVMDPIKGEVVWSNWWGSVLEDVTECSTTYGSGATPCSRSNSSIGNNTYDSSMAPSSRSTGSLA